MWLGVAPRTNTRMICVEKRLDYVLLGEVTFLGSIVNINRGTYIPFSEHENLHFDNE